MTATEAKTTLENASWDGCIEKRETLMDGTLCAGAADREKPQKIMYMAMLSHHHHLWYGKLHDTIEEAQAEGRAYCENVGLYVGCFYQN